MINKKRKQDEDIRSFNEKIEKLRRAKELKKLERTSTIGLPKEMQKKYPAIFQTADKYKNV